MKKTILFILILVFVSSPSFGQYYDGNDLLSFMNAYDEFFESSPRERLSYSEEKREKILAHGNLVMGYIMGAHDSYNTVYFETPARFKTRQLWDTVKKYIKAHPKVRHYIASKLVLNALKEAFPKKK